MGISSLARRFRVDVSADGVSWLQLKGMTDFNPQVNPNTEDSSTYDSDGWASSEITMNAWSVEVTVQRQTVGGVFDPGQELVRARQAKFGEDARIYVRWYDKTGAPEAHSGRGIVEWNRSKSGVKDLDEAKASITGDGALSDIANPYQATAVAVVSTATPSAAAAGAQVQIGGQNFTGATVVKFGATNASAFTVVSDSLIVAVVPAGTAGAAAITITTPAGTSAAFGYTRGA